MIDINNKHLASLQDYARSQECPICKDPLFFDPYTDQFQCFCGYKRKLSMSVLENQKNNLDAYRIDKERDKLGAYPNDWL